MESQDQVSASDKSASENEGIEMQERISSDTLRSERNDCGSIIEHEEVKHTSDEVGSMTTKDKDTSSTESSNFITKSKSAGDESRNVPVEKEELCLLTESSNISANEEKSDTTSVKVGEVSLEKDLSRAISTEALTVGEKVESTSIESSVSTSSFDNKGLSHTDELTSPDSLTQQASDGENVLKHTGKESQKLNSGTAGEVSQVESSHSLCKTQKETDQGNIQVDSASINEERGTHGSGETISPDKQQDSERAESASGIIKNSADDVETTASESTNNKGTADATEIVSEGNATKEQSITPTDTVCAENISCEISEATTKNAADENVAHKRSVDTPEAVGENVTKEHSNVSARIEALHLKRDENVTSEPLPTAETAVGETASNETADVATSETEPKPGEMEDDSERRAFFYISSSSIPGMGKEWEWPSVSCEYQYQTPPRRMESRRNRFDCRNCLGTQRCHYIILAVGVLGAILGCITYHLQDYGIGPKVLRPIGASAAFLSFVVCAISSVYLTYLSYYPQERSSDTYQPLGATDPAASILVDTVPQRYSSDPRFYFTSSAAATFQQVFRETQSADDLDRRGFLRNWHQPDFKRPFDEPGPSGYDPESKRIKMDPATGEGEAYEMRSMRRTSEKDRRTSEKDRRSKERNASQASDGSHYTLADQGFQFNSSEESENGEKIPLLPKK